jgi:YD repeat-containing protein
VTDIDNDGGFIDGADQDIEYEYDANGNIRL